MFGQDRSAPKCAAKSPQSSDAESSCPTVHLEILQDVLPALPGKVRLTSERFCIITDTILTHNQQDFHYRLGGTTTMLGMTIKSIIENFNTEFDLAEAISFFDEKQVSIFTAIRQRSSKELDLFSKNFRRIDISNSALLSACTPTFYRKQTNQVGKKIPSQFRQVLEKTSEPRPFLFFLKMRWKTLLNILLRKEEKKDRLNL